MNRSRTTIAEATGADLGSRSAGELVRDNLLVSLNLLSLIIVVVLLISDMRGLLT